MSFADAYRQAVQQQPASDWGRELIPLGPEEQARARIEREKAMAPKWDPARTLGIGEQVLAGLASDPAARMAYYAERRFPDLTPKQRQGRYRVVDGRVAYSTDPKGTEWFYEDPPGLTGVDLGALSSGGLFTNPLTRDVPQRELSLDERARARAEISGLVASVGQALTQSPSMVGGAIGGFIGGIPGAAAGSAIGSGIQQGMAYAVTGQEPSFERLASDVAWETGGQAAGRLGAGIWARMRGGRIPPVSPEMERRAAMLREEASRRDMRIPLTADEITGDPKLRAIRQGLENTTEGSRVMLDFYRGRNKDVQDAINSLLTRLSPDTPSVYSASRLGQEGAEAVLKAEQAALSARAAPLYEEAYAMPITVTPSMERLMQRPSVQTAIKRAERLMRDAGLKPNQERMQYWDYTKRALDDMISASERGGMREQARALLDAKSTLVRELDDQTIRGPSPYSADVEIDGRDFRLFEDPSRRSGSSPYAEARATYAEGAPAKTDLERGVVGMTARLPSSEVDRAADIIFGTSSSADEVRLAREAFQRAGQDDAWRGLLRAHLEKQLVMMPDEPIGTVRNIAAVYRKRLLGTEAKRRMMAEAFAGQGNVADDFEWLMQTFDAINRGAQTRSHLLVAQDADRYFRQVARGMLPPEDALAIWRQPSKIQQFVSDMQTGKFARRMAEVFTSPDSLAQLRAMKGVSPRSAEAMVFATHLMLPRALRWTPASDGPATEPLGAPRERRPRSER